MKEGIGTRIFDIDGTIKNPGKNISPQVIAGFHNLADRSVQTTVATGRSRLSAQGALGVDLNTIIQPSTMPISLENGGRIVEGRLEDPRNVKYHRLSPVEITAILDAVNVNNIHFLAYFPEDLRQRGMLWTPNPNDVPTLKQKYGHFINIIAWSNFKDVEEKMLTDNPCMVEIKARDTDYVIGLFPQEMSVTTNNKTIQVNAQGVNKGTSVIEIADILDLPLETIGVAGNDVNDRQMLSLSTLGERIVIGGYTEELLEQLAKEDPTRLKRFDSPAQLGIYLQSLVI